MIRSGSSLSTQCYQSGHRQSCFSQKGSSNITESTSSGIDRLSTG